MTENRRPSTEDRRPMKRPSLLLFFLLTWLVINTFQAYFTSLFNDEAYYYFYSRDLAWGYYDHPPFIALLIRLGYGIFRNELGVRLFSVLLSLATILIIRKAAGVKNELLFTVLYFSFLVFQITGFLAIPDSSLLFFTALFFLAYKKYSLTHSLKDGIILGIVMAGMFYSKYLGIFIVFFTVMSDVRLFGKKSFWVSVAVTSVLFLPHLIWQYRHDFPSFYYHLLERSHDESFRWANFGEYIVGQLGQVNPMLFIPVIIFLFSFKPGNSYERSLKFSAIGCLFLPFLMMLKGRVEANWTMAGMIPLFIIAIKMFESRPSFHRFLYISGAISIALILLARILLIYDFLPVQYGKMMKLDNRGWSELSETISRQGGDRPVVFVGTYQGPSQYIFQTGKQAFSFNNALYRNNQFDLENIEEGLQGKDVMIVINKGGLSHEDRELYGLTQPDSIQFPNGRFRYVIYDTNYHSYNFIKAKVLLEDFEMYAGAITEIPILLENQENHPVDFKDAAPAKSFLCCYFLKKGKPVVFKEVEDISDLKISNEYKTSFKIQAPDIPGTYYLKISIKSGYLPPGINSRLIKINVS
jgi:hypothetical protein